jgi:hypothetical protein
MFGDRPLPLPEGQAGKPAKDAMTVGPGCFLASWTGLTLANLVLDVSTQPPTRVTTWIIDVLSAMLISLAETLVIAQLAAQVLRSATSWWHHTSLARRRAVAVSVTVLLALPVTGLVGWGVHAARDALASRSPACSDPATITVLTSADFHASVTEAARAFEKGTADGGCPTAAVHVTETDRAQARTAMRQDWPDSAFQAVGARPDLWIADRALDLAPASRQSPRHLADELASPQVVAHSAVQLASAQAWAQPAALSWRDAVDQLRALGRPVIRPEPSASVVGQLALLKDYPGDLAGEDTHEAHRYESGYATSFSQTRWRRADVPTLLRDAGPLLCGSAASPLRPAVLVLPAFLTAASAHPPGQAGPVAPLGAQLARCPAQRWPQLRTMTVTGDPVTVELAVARLSWTGDGPGAAADRFRAWLAGDDGRSVLTGLGWEPGPAERGTDERAAEAALDRYQAARTTARVALAVDASASMKALRPEVLAVVTALVEQLSPADEVRPFGFVRPANAGPQIIPAADLGPAQGAGTGGSCVDRIRTLLDKRLVDGDTPLSTALDRGAAELSATSRPDDARDTLLVILDGRDVVDPPVWDAVARRAAVAGHHVVLLIVEGSGGSGVGVLTSSRVHLVSLGALAPGQQALQATTSLLWRATP